MPHSNLVLRAVDVSDAEELAKILITSNEDTFRGRVPDQCLTFTETESAASWRRTLMEGLPPDDFLVVAEPPGYAPIGYAWSGPRDNDLTYRGELQQIAIHPAWQRQGIGRLLMGHVAGHLVAQGIHRMRVEVLRVNPNRRFYERLGARYLMENTYDWDGVELSNCIYGWDDTQVLQSETLAGCSLGQARPTTSPERR